MATEQVKRIRKAIVNAGIPDRKRKFSVRVTYHHSVRNGKRYTEYDTPLVIFYCSDEEIAPCLVEFVKSGELGVIVYFDPRDGFFTFHMSAQSWLRGKFIMQDMSQLPKGKSDITSEVI